MIRRTAVRCFQKVFLIADEMLMTSRRILKGMHFHQTAIQRNLQQFTPFAATERVLMALVKEGADRQEMHERLRGHSLAAWQAVQAGQENPLVDLLSQDERIGGILGAGRIHQLMRVDTYLGIARQEARRIVEQIRMEIQENTKEQHT